MLVELSDVAVADELTEEEVDDLVSELETELDLLEVAEDVAEMEELIDVLEAEEEEAETDEDDGANEAVEEIDPLVEADADEEDVNVGDGEATLSLMDTTVSLFLEGNPPTKKAESTM
ncbi:hypothetical protein KCU91_g107, partial [Aureobasidium melanogenum]